MATLEVVQKSTQETQLYDIKLRVINIATNEFSKDLVYHNIAFINRIVESIQLISDNTELTPVQKFDLQVIGWLSFIGLADVDTFDENSDPKGYIAECTDHTSKRAREIMQEVGIPLVMRNRVINVIQDAMVEQQFLSVQSRVLSDAIYSDFARPDGLKYLKRMYRESLLLGVLSYSTKKWMMASSEFLTRHSYKTEFGREYYEPEKIKLIHEVEKQIKEYRRTNETLLRREMNISSEELKQLKKKLKKVRGRNERGVQTMFRTTSRNHYTLNQMLDRKANILISINTIILSVIITRLVADSVMVSLDNLPIIIMVFTALASILFAILAIMPEKTHGEFTESEIRNKEGNLLFFGNFYNMSIRDYTWGMLQMINDGEHLYMSMIRDLYYFGKQLAKKYKMLRFSLFTLGFGLSTSTITFMIVSNI